jgi:hypothetical protein
MAQNNLEESEKIVTWFLSRVSECQPDRAEFRLAEFCNTAGEIWQHYSGWAGVYYLYSDDGIVHYVGEGISPYGLGYRILGHAAKCKLLENPAMKVGLITFGKSDLPFALALERFLIRDLCPPCNIQGRTDGGSD